MRNNSITHSSAVLVTHGPLAGRILYSDDDGAESIESIREQCEADDESEIDRLIRSESEDGYVAVSYCYKLYPFFKHQTHILPHAWLKVPTLGELFERYQAAKGELHDWDPYEDHVDAIEYCELSEEIRLILNEIAGMEERNRKGKVLGKKVFLCHASEDKGRVRQVHQDLLSKGHYPWIDEAEIKVGQSIVILIDKAIGDFDVFILFMSRESLSKPWVEKEWGAGLMRKLSDANLLFIPARLNYCDPPTLLGDLRYADFADSYSQALDNILDAIDTHFIAQVRKST